MRTQARAIGAIITLFVMIAVTLWGAHAWNTQRYAGTGPDVTNRTLMLHDHGGTPVDGDYLSGIHYHGTIPGTIVVFGGADGGTDLPRALQLRDLGYDVLALYYFGQAGQEPDLTNVPLEFFQEALTWIDDRHTLDEPLTVLGSSKGAELTANLAARYPDIDNIVLYSPSEHTYPGTQNSSRRQNSSFTWQGKPVPFAPFTMS